MTYPVLEELIEAAVAAMEARPLPEEEEARKVVWEARKRELIRVREEYVGKASDEKDRLLREALATTGIIYYRHAIARMTDAEAIRALILKSAAGPQEPEVVEAIAPRNVERLLSIAEMAKTGTVSESTISLILYGLAGGLAHNFRLVKRVDGEKVLTPELCVTLDVVAHMISNRWREDVLKQKEPEALQLLDAEDFLAIAGEKDLPMKVIITDSDYRRAAHAPGLQSSKIARRISKLSRLIADGELPVRTAAGTVYIVAKGSFADIYYPKSGEEVREARIIRKGFHRGERERVYVVNVAGHIWGAQFFFSAMAGNVRVFPKRFYTSLNPQAALLFRAIYAHAEGLINLHQIEEIYGWKPDATKRTMRDRLKEIDRLWGDLIRERFVERVAVEDRADGLRYRYKLAKGWIDEPEKLLPPARIL